jgi:hypothetical protein
VEAPLAAAPRSPTKRTQGTLQVPPRATQLPVQTPALYFAAAFSHLALKAALVGTLTAPPLVSWAGCAGGVGTPFCHWWSVPRGVQEWQLPAHVWVQPFTGVSCLPLASMGFTTGKCTGSMVE